MTVAASLLDAANLSHENLIVLWEADTLKTKMIAFWQQVNGDFPDQNPNSRPIGAWIAVIAAFAPTIVDYIQEGTLGSTGLVGLGSITTFDLAVDYIYRLFKFADAYYGENLISDDQATALLDAYNAQFA